MTPLYEILNMSLYDLMSDLRFAGWFSVSRSKEITEILNFILEWNEKKKYIWMLRYEIEL